MMDYSSNDHKPVLTNEVQIPLRENDHKPVLTDTKTRAEVLQQFAGVNGILFIQVLYLSLLSFNFSISSKMTQNYQLQNNYDERPATT